MGESVVRMTHNTMCQMKRHKWGSCNSNNIQYNGQMKWDKWGSCNSNDTQHNGQMKKDKWGS